LSRFADLSLQLAPALKAGAYTGVLWDDTAGRFLGLAYHELAALVADENGKPIPFGVGVLAGEEEVGNGTRKRSFEDVARDVDAVSEKLGPKVLVVTDQMNTGGALRRIVSGLQARQKKYDLLIDGPSLSRDDMKKHPKLIQPGVTHYRPASNEGSEPWGAAHLTAARGVDIDLTGPKATRGFRIEFPRVIARNQPFLAEEARRQVSVIVGALHQQIFHQGEQNPRKIADTAAAALNIPVRRSGLRK
jgi:hypothetical protein